MLSGLSGQLYAGNSGGIFIKSRKVVRGKVLDAVSANQPAKQFDFIYATVQEIYHTLCRRLNIQRVVLGAYPGGTPPGVACPTPDTAHGYLRGGGNVNGVRTQRQRLCEVGRGAKPASRNQRYAVTLARFPQVSRTTRQKVQKRQCLLLPGCRRRRAGAAFHAV